MVYLLKILKLWIWIYPSFKKSSKKLIRQNDIHQGCPSRARWDGIFTRFSKKNDAVIDIERYKCLGNSFPNWHSALPCWRTCFLCCPYSGEVALHMLGIHLKTVISVEIGEVNVDHTQSGMLINSVDREVSH
jgi:hypothetical protein